jgi:hypothetical protein
LRRSSLVAMVVWAIAVCCAGMRESRSFGVWSASPEQVTLLVY